jgi:hypothetical protein
MRRSFRIGEEPIPFSSLQTADSDVRVQAGVKELLQERGIPLAPGREFAPFNPLPATQYGAACAVDRSDSTEMRKWWLTI